MTTLFLVLSLVLPRGALAICWLAGWMPANSTPFEADLVAFIVCPRLLVALWAYQAGSPIWAVLNVAVWAFVALGPRQLTRTRQRSHEVS